MPLTTAEQLSQLNARLAKVEAENAALKARLEPKPAPKPKPAVPMYGTTQIDSSGMTGQSYGGAPTMTAGGETWVKERRGNGDWKSPDGIWRDKEGHALPKEQQPAPVGPPAPRTFVDDVIDRIPLTLDGDR